MRIEQKYIRNSVAFALFAKLVYASILVNFFGAMYKIEVINIGDELLLGLRQNTHLDYLGLSLHCVGKKFGALESLTMPYQRFKRQLKMPGSKQT